MGRFPDDRQFMVFISGAFPGEERVAPTNWQDVKRWIAIIHIFDPEGNHLTTEARLVGLAREEPLHVRMDAMLTDLLNDYKIDKKYFCDIWIKPFRTVIDDIYYEFVYVREEDGQDVYEQMALWPNDLAFYAPWNDGHYDT